MIKLLISLDNLFQPVVLAKTDRFNHEFNTGLH